MPSTPLSPKEAVHRYTVAGFHPGGGSHSQSLGGCPH